MRRELRILILAFVLIVGPAVILTGLAGRLIAHWRVILETQMERSASRALSQAATSAATSVLTSCDGLKQTVVRAWSGPGRWTALVNASASFRSAARWCKGVYMVGSDGRVVYPPRVLAASDGDRDERVRPIYRHDAAAEALSLQYARTNDAAAVREYAKLLAQPGLDPVLAAQARLLSASCHRRMGRLHDAELDLRQVANGAGGGGPVCDPDERYHLDLVAQQVLVEVMDEAGDKPHALDDALSLAEGIVARYPRIPVAQRGVLIDFVTRRVPLLLPTAGEDDMRRWDHVSAMLAEWGRSGDTGDTCRAVLEAGGGVWHTTVQEAPWRWISTSGDSAFLMSATPDGAVLVLAVDPQRLHEALRIVARRGAPVTVRFELVSPFAPYASAAGSPRVLAEQRLAAPFGAFSLTAVPADEAAFAAAALLQTRLYAWGAGVLALAIVAGGALLWRISAAEIRSARQRSEFAATVSHDLRTPLSSMRMLAESLYLGRIADDHKRQRFLGTIVNECDRLSRLTERALYFIRYGQGALHYRLTEGDLGALVREIADTFAARGVERDHPLHVTVAEALPAVRFDAGAMEQVVLNLLDNADKYTTKKDNRRSPDPAIGGERAPPPSDIRVSLDVSGDRCHVILSVQDHGIGIPAADLPHIFRPYYRGERAKNSDATGIGLGLALCRHVVRAHGGRIEVESVVGEGSTFRVVLPAV